MVRYIEILVVNHCEQCCASGCESLCVMLSLVFGNYAVNAVPVSVNHGE